VARSDSGVAEATSPPPRTLNRHSVGGAPGASPLAFTHTRPVSSSMHTPVVAARRMRSAKVSSWISATSGTVTLRIAPLGTHRVRVEVHVEMGRRIRRVLGGLQARRFIHAARVVENLRGGGVPGRAGGDIGELPRSGGEVPGGAELTGGVVEVLGAEEEEGHRLGLRWCSGRVCAVERIHGDVGLLPLQVEELLTVTVDEQGQDIDEVLHRQDRVLQCHDPVAGPVLDDPASSPGAGRLDEHHPRYRGQCPVDRFDDDERAAVRPLVRSDVRTEDITDALTADVQGHGVLRGAHPTVGRPAGGVDQDVADRSPGDVVADEAEPVRHRQGDQRRHGVRGTVTVFDEDAGICRGRVVEEAEDAGDLPDLVGQVDEILLLLRVRYTDRGPHELRRAVADADGGRGDEQESDGHVANANKTPGWSAGPPGRQRTLPQPGEQLHRVLGRQVPADHLDRPRHQVEPHRRQSQHPPQRSPPVAEFLTCAGSMTDTDRRSRPR
jgi:hypothetical protein